GARGHHFGRPRLHRADGHPAHADRFHGRGASDARSARHRPRHGLRRARHRNAAGAGPRHALGPALLGAAGGSAWTALPRGRPEPAALLARALRRFRGGLHHPAACGGRGRLHRRAGRRAGAPARALARRPHRVPGGSALPRSGSDLDPGGAGRDPRRNAAAHAGRLGRSRSARDGIRRGRRQRRRARPRGRHRRRRGTVRGSGARSGRVETVRRAHRADAAGQRPHAAGAGQRGAPPLHPRGHGGDPGADAVDRRRGHAAAVPADTRRDGAGHRRGGARGHSRHHAPDERRRPGGVQQRGARLPEGAAV
ncbi:MAG: Putative hydrolase, partial [uncultured Craurococcus sp.]